MSIVVKQTNFQSRPQNIRKVPSEFYLETTDRPGGPAGVLEGGLHGRPVPAKDLEQMAKAILETLMDPPDSQKSSDAVIPFEARTIANSYLREVGLG